MMHDKEIDIRKGLHEVIGMMRRNEMFGAYEVLLKMSKQLDDIFYGNNGGV